MGAKANVVAVCEVCLGGDGEDAAALGANKDDGKGGQRLEDRAADGGELDGAKLQC